MTPPKPKYKVSNKAKSDADIGITPLEELPSKKLKPKRKAECQPLLELATPRLYKDNAFRITGLDVTATPREAKKHAEQLQMMEGLGHGVSAHTHAFAPSPPPTIEEIRDAINRLKEPEYRIIDEFFWFWPEDVDNADRDAALLSLHSGSYDEAYGIWIEKEDDTNVGYIACHNLAVLFYIFALLYEEENLKGALDEDQEKQIVGFWKESFKRWETVVLDDKIWSRVSERIRSIDDARLTTGFSRRMRDVLPEALDKINAELAISYARKSRIDLAKLHVTFMKETHQGLDDIDSTAELVLSPTRQRIKRYIDDANNLTDSPVIAASRLLRDTQPLLGLFELFFGTEDERNEELYDEIADTAFKLVTSTKAKSENSNAVSKEIHTVLKKSLEIATSIELRQEIQEQIGLAKLNPILNNLRSIKDANISLSQKISRIESEIITELANLKYSGVDSEEKIQLSDAIAIVLRGIGIEAHNEHEDTTLALEAVKKALSLGLSEERRERLIGDWTQLQVSFSMKAIITFMSETGLGFSKKVSFIEITVSHFFSEIERMNTKVSTQEFDQFMLLTAQSMRKLAIDACNNQSDYETGVDILNKSIAYARKMKSRDNELESQLESDLNTVERNRVASANKSSGCFIATAAYGTTLAPELDTLRFFRDNTLAKSYTGRIFVSFYYRISPSVAAVVSKSNLLRGFVRAALMPIVNLLRKR